MLDKLPEYLIRFRIPILIAAHVVIFSTAYGLAFCLRFDFNIPAEMQERFLITWPAVVSIQIVTLLLFRSFHGWWRYVTLRDLVALAYPLATAAAVMMAIDFLIVPFQIPRTVHLLNLILAGTMIAGIRCSWRLIKEGLWPGTRVPKDCTPAFIISNSHETLALANQINTRLGSKVRIVGILSDDAAKIGSNRAGIPILGTPEDGVRLAKLYRLDQIWIVTQDITGKSIREIKQLYDEHGVKLKVIPANLDVENESGLVPLRDIEIEDLLQRESVQLNTGEIASQLQGSRVMVTGAGGSIGSEICRQVAKFNPGELLLLDHRENSVFLIHRELQDLKKPDVKLVPLVADILDRERMESIFELYRPEYIYHAAAHKHVGLMELNAGEAIKTNILGTREVADLADEYQAKKFVLISTDKAVNPTSVMGCTKQIAERYVHAKSQTSDTAFVSVRFGNVLGSNGSVVPLFKDQIARGGPVTVTDPRMTRFFMTIPEASQLVLQAASMGKGGEIYVLDMGEQLSIVELARQMIRLAGLPETAIEIEYTGCRPGEKLYEELYFNEERMLDTRHPKIFAATHREFSIENIEAIIGGLSELTSSDNETIRLHLKRIVPEYQATDGEPAPAVG